MSEKAFTLAEVMITLIVVGIVAAVTVPVMMKNETARVDSERQANIVYKMANAMSMMKVYGELEGGFENTEAFVNRLKKYIKIDKICDSDHIADCWPTKKVIARSGETYDVSNAKLRKDIIGVTALYPENPNVGIVLADGAHLILTYNPGFKGEQLCSTCKTEPVFGRLPAGKGVEIYRSYANEAMKGLAFIMDVNGKKGPNKEVLNLLDGDYMDARDIRSFNGAHFIAGKKDPEFDTCSLLEGYSQKITVDGTCYFNGTAQAWGNRVQGCPTTDEIGVDLAITNHAVSENKGELIKTCKKIVDGLDGRTFPFSFYAGRMWANDGTSGRGLGDSFVVVYPGCGSTNNFGPDMAAVLCSAK